MVYKNLGSDDEFIKIITKITILNLTSIFVTILCISTVILYDLSVYAEFTHHFAIITNYFMNFASIILSYTFYDKYYYKLFGCINKSCNGCWFRILTGEKIETKLAMSTVNSTSPSRSRLQSTSSRTTTQSTPDRGDNELKVHNGTHMQIPSKLSMANNSRSMNESTYMGTPPETPV